ncbi:TIR domain-containing protein [Luteibacter sp. PPL201]|uniref:TIR domain-containing protein n=1 Tax=Luteibacter sahnii TaxID=3021977 RepID=A0ABT6BC86_9GAMM
MSGPEAFLSYHFDCDHGRADVVRAMSLSTRPPLAPDAWAMVADDEAAYRWWLDGALLDSDAFIVLVGTQTALRPRVLQKILHASELGVPLLGIRVHQMANGRYGASAPGFAPFSHVNLLDAAGRSFRHRLYAPDDESGADIGKDIAAWVRHAWVWQGSSRPLGRRPPPGARHHRQRRGCGPRRTGGVRTTPPAHRVKAALQRSRELRRVGRMLGATIQG